MESVSFNKNQPQHIRVPAVEETFKMANKLWSTRTLCFPLSHLSCSPVFSTSSLSMSFCLSLCPTSFTRSVFVFHGSLYRKLCILEAFRKAESRFPVLAMVTKNKKGERKRERLGGVGWKGFSNVRTAEEKADTYSSPLPSLLCPPHCKKFWHFKPPLNSSTMTSWTTWSKTDR